VNAKASGTGDEPATIAVLFHGQLNLGGVETHLLSLLRLMPALGAPDRPRWLILAAASPEFSARATALGARVLSWTPRRAWDVQALRRLVQLLRDNHVTLIHSHSPLAAWQGGLAGMWLRRPRLVTVHLPLYDYVVTQGRRARLKRRGYMAVEAIIERLFSSYVVYVSERVWRTALALRVAPPRASRVVANGIDLAAMRPTTPAGMVRAGLGVQAESVVLCCVCRLVLQKGVDVLLTALAHLPAEPAWELWLIGDGPERPALQAQAEDLVLMGRVRFLGFRYNVNDFLGASDVFVLPSRAEATAMALLEAMAAGKACVATGVGENPALLVPEVSGLLVPPENAAALSAALGRLIADGALRDRLGQEARQIALTFDERQMVNGNASVYRMLLNG
jgi:glycosyltransferase involved in cell wall biosynthesis